MAMTWSNPAAVLQANRVRVSKAVCSTASGTEAFAPKGLYAAGTTYAAGDVVTSSGIPYVSLQGTNVGHTPATSPAYWMPLVALGRPNFDPAGVYAAGDVVRSAGALYVALNAVDGSSTPLDLPASDGTNWAVLPHAGVAGLDLQGLQAVAPVVELAAGGTIGAGASLRVFFINPATGQVNQADPADFPASLTSGYAGQALPGWAVAGPSGYMLAVPVAIGAASTVYLNGNVRPAILGA